MNLKPTALVLCASVAFAIGASAEDAGDAVIVLLDDGEKYETLISATQKIEFGDAAVSVVTPDASESFEYQKIDKILIGAKPNSVASVISEGNIAVWPKAVTSTLNVAGVAPGTVINIYSANGQLFASRKSSGDTEVFDFSNAAPGVYVINIEKKSVRIIK